MSPPRRSESSERLVLAALFVTAMTVMYATLVAPAWDQSSLRQGATAVGDDMTRAAAREQARREPLGLER